MVQRDKGLCSSPSVQIRAARLNQKKAYWVKSEFQVNNSIFFFFLVYVCPKNCIWDLYTKIFKNPLLFYNSNVTGHTIFYVASVL